MVNWGIIGCGGIARRRMLPASQHMKKTRFVALMDADLAVTQDVAREYGAKPYSTEAELLADPEVQAVYIATPVFMHHPQVLQAAAAGKHILVEKPLSLTPQLAEEMLEACETAGVNLVEGYMMRYHALNTLARDMVASGEIGEVVFARAQLSCWYPDIPGAWRQDPRLGGGGALMDMATHLYDLMEYVVGHPIVEVAAYTGTLTFQYPVDDSSTTLLRFANGAQGVADAFFNVPDAAGQDRLEVYGNKGSIQGEGTIGQMPVGRMVAYLSDSAAGYDPAQSKDSLDVQVRELDAAPVNMYAAEADYLSECIENSVPATFNSGKGGLHILKVAHAAYESARTGRSVKL